ncbi:MAG: HEAT repeat domain-containing protein [Planctomycetales bacterium]|nr:HEAT repeat domain-containing protein [Planctomycetales bacterium]
MTDAPQDDVRQLVSQLSSENPVERQDARAALVRINTDAVPHLIEVLDAPQQHLRWEAAKALADIADPAAAEPLVLRLGDEDTDVRWVAGEALIAIGRDAVRPLLDMLTRLGREDGIPEGAHHVVHDLAGEHELAPVLKPVLKAFDTAEPGTAVPLAAHHALAAFDG